MSAEAIGWVFRKVKMDDATAKFVLVAICNYANDVDQAWPSHTTIAKLTGLSKRAVQNSIKKLEDWGIIVRERRDREDGSETSAMVYVDLASEWVVKDGMATAATGVMQQVPESGATRATLEPTLNPQSKKIRPAKQQDGNYPEEFEALWKIYPRTRNTSKKKAHDLWQMLNDDNRARVAAAVPIFAAAMRAEGRPEDKIKHFQFFLSERIYETVAAPTLSPALFSGEWWKTASREQWEKCLANWRRDSNWRAAWGPEPGMPGCCVPDDLLTENEKWLISRGPMKYRAAPENETVSRIVSPQPQRLLECDASEPNEVVRD